MENTNNNKLIALASYILAPIVGIIVLLTDMKNDAALKNHAVQSIALSVVMFIVAIILTVTVVGACLTPLLIVPGIIYGVMAYQGKDVNIPVVSDFVKKQGWV